MASSRRAFWAGAMCGAGTAVAAAAMVGLARQPEVPVQTWLTSGSDGRVAYLWNNEGGQLHYVMQAKAPEHKPRGTEPAK